MSRKRSMPIPPALLRAFSLGAAPRPKPKRKPRGPTVRERIMSTGKVRAARRAEQ